ncbi:tripartite tricarboxylate transporter TctB family protein [Pseudorhodoplanes sp.]|uniref:tripartite tricarboxylate transporter TctB family protein n=1 Tax=Pseudorhodoplanes sp. TaxID=1934341 RepID=UPI00391CEEF0
MVRSDQLAGGVFIALGIIVFILGHDLPFGSLSSPGAGMLPKLMAVLMIVIALGIMATGGDSERVRDIPWSDWPHAVQIVIITAIATAVYTWLGFLFTMSLLVFSLLIVVERKSILAAGTYAVLLTLFSYWLFGIALKAPLERGLLWF